MENPENIVLTPQPGPQEAFLSSEADIAIFGGAAGGGKTYALLLEALRHTGNHLYSGVIFRRIGTHISNPGGLWHTSNQLYHLFGAEPLETKKTWVFPSGCPIKFAHLEHEKNKLDWQGAQIPFIGFDELTHFTESQFFYMMSRNRSDSGVSGYIRATTNPDADSWVAKFLEWWIDQDTGLAIQERSGVLRWFVRPSDSIVWGDTREELKERYPDLDPKSVTFVPASVYDNKILLEKDPSYLSSLMALPRVERERLLGANWKVRPSSGLYFKTEFFKTLDALPHFSTNLTVRYWDRAATEKTSSNNPDWTVGVKMTRTGDGRFVIEDVKRFQASPGRVEELIKNTTAIDGLSVIVGIEQDPGQAGKFESQYYARQLAGYNVKIFSKRVNKITAASPLSAQAEAGNIYVLRGTWNKDFFLELENFPEGGNDDQVDAASGAFNVLTNTAGRFGKEYVPTGQSTVAGPRKDESTW